MNQKIYFFKTIQEQNNFERNYILSLHPSQRLRQVIDLIKKI